MLRLILSLKLVIWISGAAVFAESSPQSAKMPKKHISFFESYCLDCHDSDTRKGKVDLESLPLDIATIQSAELWQKVLNTLNSGEMPPENKKAPDHVKKTEFLADLSETLVVARKLLSDTGGVTTMRRLNRREYANTIRDLLGVYIQVDRLPADTREGSFDTGGNSLYISSDQIGTYRELGNEALKETFNLTGKKIKTSKHRIDFENRINQLTNDEFDRQISIKRRYQRWTRSVDQAATHSDNVAIANQIRQEFRNKKPIHEFYRHWARIPSAPNPADYGFPDAEDAFHHDSQWGWILPKVMDYSSLPSREGGIYLTDESLAMYAVRFSIPGNWPAGEVIVRIRAAQVPQRVLKPSRNEIQPTIITKSTSEQNRYFLDVDSADGRFTIGTHQVLGSIEEPQTIDFHLRVYPGEQKQFRLRERGGIEGVTQNRSKQYKKQFGVDGTDPAIWIDYVEMEGPFYTAAEKSRHQLVKSWMNRVQRDEAGEVGKVISEFATLAYRGRVASPEFVVKLEAIYHDHRSNGTAPLTALHETLSIILASPSFLYLAEAGGTEKRPLTQFELAARLSYFLWSAPPDQQLLDLANESKLIDPVVMQLEVDRMLSDPKSSSFVEAFLDQWLGLDRLDFFQFNVKKYPEFTAGTKKVARREIYETFAHWLYENGSLTNLLASDTIIINGLLADLYGIPDVVGDHFRPVAVPPSSPRGGLLGMAAVAAMGSNGDHTSPVERGAWVLRKLVNNPPPPAPPNIPQLARLDKKSLSTRDRIALHQEEPQCAQCHRRIDPIGFGLENFDAAGKWRTLDDHEGVPVNKRTIDPSGQIHNGPAFKDFFELRSVIHQQYPEPFATGFAENLAEYALGRPVGFTDADLIEKIACGGSIRSLILTLVQSETFLTKK